MRAAGRWAATVGACLIAACAKGGVPPAGADAGAPRGDPTGEAVLRLAPGSVKPLTCSSPRSCADGAGVHYSCSQRSVRTGRGQGLATTCVPDRCEAPPCASVALLTGEVVQGDAPGFPKLPNEDVVVSAVPDLAELARTRTDAAGRYAFVVPAGAVLFVSVQRDGFVTELHGVQVPALGWDVPLDLRKPEAFRFGSVGGPPQDPEKGMTVAEFLGAPSRAGLGLRTAPAGNEPITLDGQRKPVVSPTLLADGIELHIVLNLPVGTFRPRWISPEGVRCAPQAAAITDWPSRPGVLTQIDVECR